MVNLSRRIFNKKILSMASVSVLAGYSKPTEASYPEIAQTDEEIFSSCAAHNCKGRCVTKVHVKNNTITRITTDSRPDTYGNPQMRACLRCRAYKTRVHHPGRLLYPLIYDEKASKRGDVRKFRRVSWKEAINYIKEKYNAIRRRYPAECVYQPCGSGGTVGKVNGKTPIVRVLNGLGGYIEGWGSYSNHAVNYISPKVAGKKSYYTFGTTPENWMNTKTMIMWGTHIATSVASTNAVWWLTRARENGMKSYYISPVFENTGELADEWISIKPGTDSAMMLAMLHEMIVNNWLDLDSIENFTVGFFDDPEGNKPEVIPGSADYLKVPSGMSLSAYILGDTKLKENRAACAYTFNNRKSAYAFKKEFNLPKTPEWAEKITGVPAAKIREVAEAYCTQKPSMIYSSLGLQRQHAGVDNTRLIYALTLASGNWGRPGTGAPFYYLMSGNTAGTGKARYTGGKNPVKRPARFSNTLWSDAVRSRGQGISKYDDPEIEAMVTPIKIIFAPANNTLINQHMDPFTTAALLEDRSNVELIVAMDSFMTPSAKFADVILPCTTPHEHEDIIPYHNNLVYQARAIDVIKSTGEVKSLFEIGEMMADAFDLKSKEGKNLVTEGKTVSQWVKELYYGEPKNMSFDDFKKEGIYTKETQGILYGSGYLRSHGRCDPHLNFGTKTGYIELYSQRVVEDYENRGRDIGAKGYKNLDPEGDPEVYPIPLFKPLADEYLQTGLKLNDYPFHCLGNHSLYRTHSTNANNPLLRELYKTDSKGIPERDSDHGNNPTAEHYDAEGRYEPVYMNIYDAEALNISENMRLKVTSGMTGRSLYAIAKPTYRCRQGVVVVRQGAWFDPVEVKGEKIDQGGCNSTLISDQPTRHDCGPAMMSALVRIEKAE